MTPPSLTPTQLDRVERARALTRVEGRAAVAEFIDADRPDDPSMVYAQAFGYAKETIRGLLEVIDLLTGGQS